MYNALLEAIDIIFELKKRKNIVYLVVVSELQLVIDKFSIYTVPDSFTFVNKLKSVSLNQLNSFMIVSIDMKILFTNVPLDEVLNQLNNFEILMSSFPNYVFL